MGEWSELPTDLLDAIEQLLVHYVDKVRVRAICTSWNSHLPKMPNHQVRRLPWLLQSFENNTDASHGLFDLYDKKFYMLDLPELQGKLFKGSSYGWLVTTQDKPGEEDISIISSNPVDMYLINPLTRGKIKLPPRYTFPDVIDYDANRDGEAYAYRLPVYSGDGYAVNGVQYHDSNVVNAILMDKVVLLSAAPLSDEDCFVVAIFGEVKKLAWCKSNNKEWKPLPSGRLAAFEDVIFYNGKLHALNVQGELLVFENICVNPKVKEIAKLPPGSRNLNYPMYLLECSDGVLMMITRYVDVGDVEVGALTLRTERFRVYKLDSTNSSWVRVKDIGNEIFFVGFNSSFSISCHDFPGYKGNCIYFTENPLAFEIEMRDKNECSDIGVFNLEDESVELLSGFKYNPKLLLASTHLGNAARLLLLGILLSFIISYIYTIIS